MKKFAVVKNDLTGVLLVKSRQKGATIMHKVTPQEAIDIRNAPKYFLVMISPDPLTDNTFKVAFDSDPVRGKYLRGTTVTFTAEANHAIRMITANEETVTSPVTVNENLIIEVLCPRVYPIVFAGGEGAEGDAPTESPKAKDETFELPENTFSKTGYSFIGWTTDGTDRYEAGDVYTMTDSNTTFTAVFVEANPADFATDDWSMVQLEAQRISEMGTAEGSPYSVGDTRTITLSTNEVITVVILGFNHDTLATAYDNGGTLSGISIGMVNLLSATRNMNSTDTNSGGWGSSEMRTAMATYLSQLPAAVQSVIAPVVKKTSAGDLSSTINNSTDSLWLYSHKEVMGTHMQKTSSQTSFSGEGEQYDYFKLATIPSGCGNAVSGTTGTYVGNNATYTDRFGTDRTAYSNYYLNTNSFKGLGNSPTASKSWWLRSPNYNYNNGFCFVANTGGANSNFASSSCGVAFGFCI